MQINKKFNVLNSKHLVDLKQIPYTLVNDDEKRNFLAYLDILFLQNKIQNSYLCAMQLNQDELLSYANKIKTYKVVCTILDSLINTTLDIKEIDLVKRKILIALDKASKSFFVVIEFSRLTTTISYNSEPLDSNLQNTFHIEHEINETIVIVSYLKLFGPECNKYRNFSNVKELNIYCSYNVWYLAFVEENISDLLTLIKNATSIETVIFRNLSEDPFLKILQKNFILSSLNTFINEEDIPEVYNSLKITIKSPNLFTGFSVKLLTL